jgi:hypothetical protein
MSSTFRQVLKKIATEKAPGPSPTFSVLHVLLAIELMSEKPIGRSRLAESLEVGEGVARTMIERLRDFGLIATSKAGCTLTRKGSGLWKEHKSVFEKKVEIGKNELALGEHNFAILVKGRGDKVKSGVEQRDAAVVAGAKGATTIIFRDGRLTIPSVSGDVAKNFPNAWRKIVRLLQPTENDVIVVGSADTLGKAEYGTLAAAWTLVDDC